MKSCEAHATSGTRTPICVSIEHSVKVVPSGRSLRSSPAMNAWSIPWRLLPGLTSIAPFSLSSTLYGIAASSGSPIICSQRWRSCARESRGEVARSAVVAFMFRIRGRTADSNVRRSAYGTSAETGYSAAKRVARGRSAIGACADRHGDGRVFNNRPVFPDGIGDFVRRRDDPAEAPHQLTVLYRARVAIRAASPDGHRGAGRSGRRPCLTEPAPPDHPALRESPRHNVDVADRAAALPAAHRDAAARDRDRRGRGGHAHGRGR